MIAHDRPGHGRSTQVSDGHDMDHYAADASAVCEHLDLNNAVHIGHSTGGGSPVMSPLESGSTCEALVFYSPGRRLSPKLAQSRSADARLWSGGAERFRVGGQSGHPYSALQCPLIIQLGHWTATSIAHAGRSLA